VVIIVATQLSRREQEALMSESYSLPTEPEGMAVERRQSAWRFRQLT
jgi:hypothetical protein